MLWHGLADRGEVVGKLKDGAVVHDPARGEQDEVVKEAERLPVGLVNRGNDNHVGLFGERLDGRDDLKARGGVETRGGLIEDKDAGASDDRAGDRDTALLAARDATLERGTDPVVGDVLQAERLERCVNVAVEVGKLARESRRHPLVVRQP